MPNAAVITVNDGQNDIAFSPDSVGATHVVFQNLSGPILNQRELLHFDRPGSESKTRRRQLRINIPVEVERADGVTVYETVTMTVSCISPSDVKVADRARARVLAANALQDTAVVALFDNPEWVW